MRTLDDIRIEIEELTERRAQVMQQLSRGHDAVLAKEHQELEQRVAELWDEQRAARAERRWGDRDVIIKRARAEERLERRRLSEPQRPPCGGSPRVSLWTSSVSLVFSSSRPFNSAIPSSSVR